MAIEEVINRTLFEEFHADSRFAGLREIRSQLQRSRLEGQRMRGYHRAVGQALQ